MKEKWCIFISGTGSNMKVLLETKSSMNVALVVSNTKNAPGLLRAKRNGTPTWVLEMPLNWEHVTCKLKEFGITHIFLAGFMKILPTLFVEAWKDRIYNIHPSLLPHYKGLQSIQKSFDEKGPLGISVHAVTAGVDEGPCWRQKKLQHLKDLKSTELFVHIQEHQLVRKFAWARAST